MMCCTKFDLKLEMPAQTSNILVVICENATHSTARKVPLRLLDFIWMRLFSNLKCQGLGRFYSPVRSYQSFSNSCRVRPQQSNLLLRRGAFGAAMVLGTMQSLWNLQHGEIVVMLWLITSELLLMKEILHQAPVDRQFIYIPIFANICGVYTSQVLQDLFHQHYDFFIPDMLCMTLPMGCESMWINYL